MGKGVLFVTGTLGVGGSETKIVRIANALVEAGYNAGIAYLNPPESLLSRVDPAVSVTHLKRRGKFSIHSLQRLRGLVDREYSVLVAVNFYPLLYVLPASRLRGGRARTTICLINTTEFVDRQWIWGYFYAPFLRRCDTLVYGCRTQRELWTERYRLPAGRSLVIYNGVDTACYSDEESLAHRFRSKCDIPHEAVVFGGIGRLAAEKNFDLLIRSAAAVNDTGRQVWVIIVGEGSEREKLEAVAERLRIRNRVVFTGILDDVRPALSAMDVFVLPSRAVETFSNAALEAMAMSKAIVLSNIGGAAEMVEDGCSGHLFPAEDGVALQNILVKLYDSKARRHEIGQAARQRVVEKFDFESMLDHYKTLLESALRQSASVTQ